MKKALKISAIVIGLLLLVIIALPFVFKGKIQEAVQSEINKNLNAVVTFDGVGVTLLRHFPDLTVKVKDLIVVGKDDFEKDTLASLPVFSFTLDLSSVFRGSDYKVKQIGLTSPRLLFKVLKNGKVNWDIMKATGTTDTVSTPSAFKVYLDKISISDAHFVYDDAEIPTMLLLDGLTGTLSGDMTADITTLDINALCKDLTVDYDGVRYMSKTKAELKTLLASDLSTWTFTFKDGNMRLNDLNITADGFFAMPDEGYKMDIKFAAKENTFKAFLSLIPAIYSKDFDNIKTSGTMSFDGFVKGLYSDVSIPAFAINLKVADGMFSYPGLPGNVSDINLQAVIANPDGVMDHTTVDVPRMHLSMMQTPVDITLSLRTPVSDPDINATVKGTVNLSSVSKIYPLGDKTKLSGIINADMAFSGKISAIEKGAYDQFKASGYAAVDQLVYEGEEIPQPVNISKARLDFTPAYAQLTGLAMTIGKSDLAANGKLENYIPYVMKKQAVLKGSLTTTSDFMDINSLITGSSTPATADTSALTVVEIPGDMDLTLNTSFKKLIYDTYTMSNVNGIVKVKDHTLLLEGLNLNMLGGAVALKGSYSTFDPARPMVDMNLQVKNLEVKQAFQAFNPVQKFAPIAGKINGAISTNLKFKGALKRNMMPDLTSVSAYGLVLSDVLKLVDLNTLGKIADLLKMEKLRNPSLENINLSFDVVDGKATVKPMDFKLGSYKANISGTTGLDQVLNFVLTLDIPRAEFGNKANSVLDGLVQDASKKGVNVKLGDIVPVTILIGGTATDPKITSGIKSAMADLAADMKKQALEVVEKKKEELVTKAKDEATNLIAQADAEAARIIAEAEKQSQKLMQSANKVADEVHTAADSSANRLMAEGKKKGYIAEIASKKGASVVKKEGEDKAAKILAEAKKQSDVVMSKARAEADKIKQDALNRVK
ncbi:MAG: AsmA-like C-terminal region-containing protein [Lentimicrobiaceae bacterium]|jgi:vacuolar-type H+-ATPase subunit H